MSAPRKAAEAAVFDASPLIFLARIHLLRPSLSLFASSLIAESVRQEVVEPGRRVGAPETAELESLLQERRLAARKVPKTSLGARLEANARLSRGDRDSLVLASLGRARLLADDAAVRSAAGHLGLSVGGTLYVLFRLVDVGSLSPREAREHLDRLVDLGWYCSARLYRAAREALEARAGGGR